MTRQPGDKIIPKLIPVIRDTIIATKKGLASHEVNVRTTSTQTIIDRMGEELAEVIQPVFKRMLDRGELPDDLHAMVEKAASGKHQWQSSALTLLGISGATSALGTVISNYMFPVTRQLVGASPHLVPNPNDLAILAARGFAPPDDAATEAGGQGINNTWFNRLATAAQSFPSPADVQELYRRNEIGQQTALQYLLHNGFNGNDGNRMLSLSQQVVSIADAALAVLRGNITHTEGVEIAAANGFSETQFEILIGNTGEPPGVMDMLGMFRRGIIDQATLERGILESRLRDEWIPHILAYRFQPMTTADAIDAFVQNHIDQARLATVAEENGLRAEDLQPLVDTAGEPLSKTEMLTLFKRGEVTAEQVKQALRESRLKDKYVDTALLLARAIPPLFTIRQLISSGSITDAEAARLLAEDGYEQSLITAIIHSAHKQKTAKVRTVTEGMLSELYQEQAISGETFISELVAFGYTKAEAEQIKQIDDWRIAKVNRDQAITHLRSQYVGGKIDEHLVQGELDALLVPSDMRDKLLADWNLEIKATVKLLSEAQIVNAWSLSLMTLNDAIAALTHLGYTEHNAFLLLSIKAKGPVGPIKLVGT